MFVVFVVSPYFPVCGGVTFCFFDASLFGVFLLDVGLVLIRIPSGLFGLGCFCLESLILAQDERWRRA